MMARAESLDQGEDNTPRSWRRRQRDIGYIAWASFLMACAAAAVFFAMVDPAVLSGTTTPGWEISREAGYAIGFFGFWLLTAATAVFAIWLVRSEPRAPTTRTPRSGGERKSSRRRGGPHRRRVRPDATGDEDRP
jgi:hypothetical protein